MDLSAHLAHRGRWTPGKAALRSEDQVAFLGPNCPELIEVLYSCARLGAIFVPLNARMPAAELRVFAEQSQPRLLVAEQSFRDVAMTTVPQVSAIFRVGSDDLVTAERGPPDPAGSGRSCPGRPAASWASPVRSDQTRPLINVTREARTMFRYTFTDMPADH